MQSNFNGIAITDEQGKLEYVNDSFLKITGFQRDELIGQSFMKLFPENILEFILERWEEFQKGIEIPYETVVKTKSGEIKCVYISHSHAEIGGKKKCVSVIRDLSEKKEPEVALKASKDMYRDIFENAIDAMYINDAEGYIQHINKAGLKIIGCSTEDIIGTHVSRWFTPDGIRLVMDTVRKKTLGEHIEDSMILQIVTKSGERRWAEIRSCAIKNGDSIIGFQGMARDITEKIRLEQELKESEAKYRELFENAQDAMYILNADGNFLKMNQIGLRILGCTEEEIIGSNVSKWLTQESLKIAEDRRKKLLSGEIINQADILELVCKNGEHRWVEIKTRHIKNDDKTIEIHGIARDITENVILKQELKKSNKQQKLLCYLIKGTRGGKTRALILKHLTDKTYNAHQLAKALSMDYKTIRHHLNVLIKHGIITRSNDGNTGLYFISKNAELEIITSKVEYGN